MRLDDVRQERKNDQCNSENACEGLGSITKQGRRARNDSNKISNSNSTREDQSRAQNHFRRQADTGEIITQLRELKESHLTYVDQNKQALEQKINENEAYRQKTLDGINQLEKLLENLLGDNKSNDD